VITSYLELINKLLEQKPVVVNGQSTKEIVNCSLWLEYPEDMFVDFRHRKLDYGYFAALVAWYLRARPGKLDGIDHYNLTQWGRIKEPDINSNYGVYVFNEGQLGTAIHRLVNDSTSRQAMILFNRPIVNISDTRDHICTTSLQFLIRDNKLITISTMRSNDFWNGLSYDVPFFMLLKLIVFEHLARFYPTLAVGPFYHNVGSMHVYEESWHALKRISSDPIRDVHTFPRFSGLVDILYVMERLGPVEEEIRAQARSGLKGRPVTDHKAYNWFVTELLKKHNLCTSS
jgi:thymidylate synthase